jgi:hypothetical protein
MEGCRYLPGQLLAQILELARPLETIKLPHIQIEKSLKPKTCFDKKFAGKI